ncbi:hypothetical protein M885DRAFT_533030 [Pelagophyceae sp. CCMP2097]|nr:hypothetical protein M885DRAFT_533030 [Pelagophyceae sp. CCMP2097]
MDRPLAVREGICFRAQLPPARGDAAGLGLTVKATRRGGFVVHALPRAAGARGRAEAAGIDVGDELLGVGDAYFQSTTLLVELVSWVQAADANAVVLLLRRGRGARPRRSRDGAPPRLRKMAHILLGQGVIDETQAVALSSSMAQLELRSEQWDVLRELRAPAGPAADAAKEPPSPRSSPPPSPTSPRTPAADGARAMTTTPNAADAAADDSDDSLGHGDEATFDGDGGDASRDGPAYDFGDGAPGGAPLYGDDGGETPNPFDGKEESPSRHSPGAKAEAPFAAAAAPRAPSVPFSAAAASRASGPPHLRVSTRRIRPALCIRILGTNYEDDHTEYSIWVLDVLAGAEWSVQRRFREFDELREQLALLRPSLSGLDFPGRRPSLYESLASVKDRRARLERHSRLVAGSFFSARLHARSGDVARLLQAFLDVPRRRESLELLEKNPDAVLRQSAQVATYQLLCLPAFDGLLADIVAQSAAHDFDSGIAMLQQIKRYIDHLQAAILDGCSRFLSRSVLRRRETMAKDDLAQVLSAAVRRQIETEVFVPLMEKVHALLRNDIEAEEMQLKHQCSRARQMPQTACGIPLHHISPSSWESAIYQLGNIGSYTLPCDKLDALLSAAREIPTLYLVEHPGTDRHLGADDFLPIFIYVLIHANIEGLASLQRVLCTLCDPDKRLSETGYYVATFEAAVQHILELDLD